MENNKKEDKKVFQKPTLTVIKIEDHQATNKDGAYSENIIFSQWSCNGGGTCTTDS